MAVSVFLGIIMHVLCIVLALASMKVVVVCNSTPVAQTVKNDNFKQDTLRRSNDDYEEMQLVAAKARFPVMAPAVSPVLDYIVKKPVVPPIDRPAVPSVKNPAVLPTGILNAAPIVPEYSARADVSPISPSAGAQKVDTAQVMVTAHGLRSADIERRRGLNILDNGTVDGSVISSQEKGKLAIFSTKYRGHNVKQQQNQSYFHATKKLAMYNGNSRGYNFEQFQGNKGYFRTTNRVAMYNAKNRGYTFKPVQANKTYFRTPDRLVNHAYPAGLQIPVGVPTVFSRPSYKRLSGLRQGKPETLKGYMDLNKKSYPRAPTRPTVLSVPGASGIGGVSRVQTPSLGLAPQGNSHPKATSQSPAPTPMTTWATKKKLRKAWPDARQMLRDAILGRGATNRVLYPAQLDMAPAKGGRVESLRLKGRLCQRHVLRPEGPKYDEKGGIHVPSFKPSRGVSEYQKTKPRKFLLPRCCNCCKKSVLGCE